MVGLFVTSMEIMQSLVCISRAKVLAMVLFCGAASLSAETVWLSSLDLKQMTTGWGAAQADRGVAGQPLSIGGKKFARGVGTHAASKLRVNLGGNASRFVAQVGVDDSAEGQGSVEFIVVGDGRMLWQSGLLTGGKPAVPVDIDIAGVQTLGLRVTEGEDGASHEPLASQAVKSGLRFGIWIEPEMVNPKSELFERHPEWVIRQPKRELELQRNQLALDLTRPDVQEFEWKVIQDTLGVPDVSYGKWDCNRYLTQPGSSWLGPERQSHLWIDYVRALYALMDRTAKAYPKTELMLCSGGGGRVDYGALRYFHEFWPSDNTDPVRRVSMQWDYSCFFPCMTLSSHVTHWGNRPMHFACAVAMSARFGMDLDLAKLPAQDRAICAGAISAYKRIREVTHLGELYRLERPHEAVRGALNFVAANRSRAVVFVFQLKDGQPLPVLPQGLDPLKEYVVRELNPAPGRGALPQEGKTFTGKELMRDGVVPSCSKAIEACVVELGF